MPTVQFLPIGIAVDVPPGTLIIDAALLAGIMIDLPCGGKGTCGKCLVQISEGAVESKESIQLTDDERKSGFVIACQSLITENVSIDIPDQFAGAIKTYLDDSIDLESDQAPEVPHLSPLSYQVFLRIPAAGHEDGLADLDRVSRSLKFILHEEEILYPLSVIQKLADTLRAEDGMVTLTLAVDGGKAHVIDVEIGHAGHNNLGIAIDLGTTTISVQLIDLVSGKVVSTKNGYNDQIRCGLDVISRINYASTQGRLEDLRTRAIYSMNRLLREALEDSFARKEDITGCRISGNTVMTHLLLGLKPEYIRLDPYTPTVLQTPPFRAFELGLDIPPNALVTISPCVGSYVGGDITAGILATDLAKDRSETSMFIDIGTNGEIVVGNSDFLMTCACSAGPAFEGSGIDCGMRATTGAIDQVTIEKDTGKAQYTTIGNGSPRGMCGSGLIDLVAGLFLSGWIDASGKFNRTKPSRFIHCEGRRASYTLADAKDSASGKPINLSENDIENLMRAKAAVYSGASLMLKQTGTTFHDLSTFYVAGGFGRFLNLDNAMAIGLLPDIPIGKFQYIGNASLSGSRLCLLSKEFRETQLALTKRMTYIDLSTFPGYMDQYTAALFLPHTDLHLFPNIMKRLNAKIGF
jgi:uncharacterized 2Fe-2S/4Fe-4S cluster protein (DUF4445 family)